jgi:SlyX protein
MSEERFIELESRIAYQDQVLHELNEVVTDQQAQLMQLKELYRSLVDRVRALGEGMPAGDPGDERPPHY